MSTISFNNNYSQNYCPINLSKENAKKMLPYIAACNAAYKNDENWILPFQFSFLRPTELNLNLPPTLGKIEARATSFFDKNTLLKVSICFNERICICVIGGAFGAGDIETNDPQERNIFRTTQILTRDSQAAGKIPLTYLQLNVFTNFLLSQPSLKNKKVILVGHSSGGSMAQYIALKNDLPAICFNPYPIGQGLQADVGKEKIETASYHISCVSVQGDFCSDALDRNWSEHPKTKSLQQYSAKNFGRKFLISSAFPRDENKTHGLVMASLLDYLGYDMRILPSELRLEDLEFCIQGLNHQNGPSDLIPIAHLKAYENHSKILQENYICQSRIALLAQAMNQKDIFWEQTVFDFLNQDEKRMICKRVWENAGSPQNGDLQWGEHHAFDDASYLANAVQQSLLSQLAKLSQDQKNQVYEQLYYLCGWPQTEDPQWGEHHATKKEYLPQLSDALFHVLSLGVIHSKDFQEKYICQSRIAMLAQAMNQKDIFWEKIVFDFLNQDEKRMICKRVWENAGFPQNGDLQWGEHHAFDDPSYLKNAVQQSLLSQLAKLSQDQKNQVYEQLYYLCGCPQTKDPQWGEHHAAKKKYLPQLSDALFHVLLRGQN